MGAQDEKNKAEPQNEFLSGFRIKDRDSSQKEDAPKPTFTQSEKIDEGLASTQQSSELQSTQGSNPYQLTQQLGKSKNIGQFNNDTFNKKNNGGFFKKVQGKFGKEKSGSGDTKQKVMVVLIPILFVIMIFMYRQVLTKPEKAKGNQIQTNQNEPVTKNISDNNIEWNKPDLLQIKIKKPDNPQENPTENSGNESDLGNIDNETLYVKSILYSSDKSSVVVGDKIVYLNQEINGAKVVEINKDYIVFEKDGRRWTQKVAEEVHQSQNENENNK